MTYKPKERRPQEPEILITQETVDALSAASTMEEFLAIAEEHGVDWDSMPDEWLSAVAEGDVTALLPRVRHRKP